LPITKTLYRLPPKTREKLLQPVRSLLSRKLERPELSTELRDRLAAELAPDAAAFRQMTGQTFAGWSV
jgi:hypothetical protein